jgi:SAM-dependent methyltransferase
MAKQGEIDYLRHIGREAVAHAVKKPFSDPHCGRLLMELGAVMSLLPPPPARVLDAGCGTGWTSWFLARRGYDVTGLDIAPDMVESARSNHQPEVLTNLKFVAADYERTGFENEFDAVIFFESLHHAEDERAALRMAFRALKPGGLLVTSEPGRGHANAESSQNAVREYGVTERDMAPLDVLRAAHAVGFRDGRNYPHATAIDTVLYTGPTRPRLRGLLSWSVLRGLAMFFIVTMQARRSGIVVTRKPPS